MGKMGESGERSGDRQEGRLRVVSIQGVSGNVACFLGVDGTSLVIEEKAQCTAQMQVTLYDLN